MSQVQQVPRGRAPNVVIVRRNVRAAGHNVLAHDRRPLVSSQKVQVRALGPKGQQPVNLRRPCRRGRQRALGKGVQA